MRKIADALVKPDGKHIVVDSSDFSWTSQVPVTDFDSL